jgi:MoxR-vWA-beta-propeller ternary system domain bpX2
LHGAWRKAGDGEGDAEAFVVGSPGKVPLLLESVRYWGTDLLVPLGFRADPDLPEQAIRRVVGAGEGDLVVLDREGFELIARSTFKPLDRAGVRLARGGFGASWPREGSPT